MKHKIVVLLCLLALVGIGAYVGRGLYRHHQKTEAAEALAKAEAKTAAAQHKVFEAQLKALVAQCATDTANYKLALANHIKGVTPPECSTNVVDAP